jgi:hypothetical protein
MSPSAGPMARSRAGKVNRASALRVAPHTGILRLGAPASQIPHLAVPISRLAGAPTSPSRPYTIPQPLGVVCARIGDRGHHLQPRRPWLIARANARVGSPRQHPWPPGFLGRHGVPDGRPALQPATLKGARLSGEEGGSGMPHHRAPISDRRCRPSSRARRRRRSLRRSLTPLRATTPFAGRTAKSAARRGDPRFGRCTAWCVARAGRGGHWPERSHSLRVLSSLPDNAMRRTGEYATDVTLSECPVNVWISMPVATSQSLRVLSSLPESTCDPSGANATDRTSSECPLNVRISVPVATSQSLRVLSLLPESTCDPSSRRTSPPPIGAGWRTPAPRAGSSI